MSTLDEQRVPSLARGCRMGPDRVLLMPEGILKLSASAIRIIELCDGKKKVTEIVATLQAEYSPAMHEKIRKDVLDYLGKLLEKKAVELR